MKKQVIFLLFFGAVSAISGTLLILDNFKPSPMYCVGDVNWNISDGKINRQIIGSIAIRMFKNEGLATLTGTLSGEKETNINRNIYFSYSTKYKSRILQTTRIITTFTDNASEEDLREILPGFYRIPGRRLSLTMYEYKGAYIISNSTVPHIYCRKYASYK